MVMKKQAFVLAIALLGLGCGCGGPAEDPPPGTRPTGAPATRDPSPAAAPTQQADPGGESDSGFIDTSGPGRGLGKPGTAGTGTGVGGTGPSGTGLTP